MNVKVPKPSAYSTRSWRFLVPSPIGRGLGRGRTSGTLQFPKKPLQGRANRKFPFRVREPLVIRPLPNPLPEGEGTG